MIKDPALYLHAIAQLTGHVVLDAVVGGGGGGQDSDVAGQPRQHLADAAVVGPEIVPPVRDAMRLVDHQQANARGDRLQRMGHEVIIRQALRRYQQQVSLISQ